MSSNVEAIFKHILQATSIKLADFGFKRRGNSFRVVSNGNLVILAFQRSQDSSRTSIKFTVNLAIVYQILLDRDTTDLDKCTYLDGNLSDRIGRFTNDQQDKWWLIENDTYSEEILNEVLGLIVEQAVPYLFRYTKTEEILFLWMSGTAPGLTEGMRIRKLNELQAALRIGNTKVG